MPEKLFTIQLDAYQIGFLQAMMDTVIERRVTRPHTPEWLGIARGIQHAVQSQFAAQAGPR